MCVVTSVTASDAHGHISDRVLAFEDYVLGIVSSLSQRIGIFRLVKGIFVVTSVLLCYYCSNP